MKMAKEDNNEASFYMICNKDIISTTKTYNQSRALRGKRRRFFFSNFA
jgi:hypothetical protein